MKPFLTMLLFLALPSASPASDSAHLGFTTTFEEHYEDHWFGMDKFLHVAATASITGLSFHVYHCQYHNAIDRSTYFSVSLAGASGIGKELYDAGVRRTHWSWKDIVADGFGIGIGYLLFIYPHQ
jgi:uncharacterized protein YfiM (DUF2279 family)